MRNISIIKQTLAFLFINISLISYGQTSNKVLFYTGTFSGDGSEGIYICNFDTVAGDISWVDVISGLENPNYLAKTDDGKFLYVCMRPIDKETGRYSVGAFQIDPKTGMAKYLNEQSSEGIDPCYVDVTSDNKFVAVANYGSGTIALYTTNPDGTINTASQIIQDQGSSIVEDRQEGPHAHSVQFSPFSNKVYSADLGTDKLMVYSLNRRMAKLETGKIPYAAIPPGSGPRHFEFNPNGRFIYVVSELSSTVSVVNINNDYKLVQTIGTLPEGYEEASYCADIHISNDGKILYCSNRGHNSITTFRVKENGLLEKVTTTSTEGDWPRNFTLAPGGFMLVANQNSNNITVFKINHKSGVPEYIGKELSIPSPVCLVF